MMIGLSKIYDAFSSYPFLEKRLIVLACLVTIHAVVLFVVGQIKKCRI